MTVMVLAIFYTAFILVSVFLCDSLLQVKTVKLQNRLDSFAKI